jgi:hypothetical protein
MFGKVMDACAAITNEFLDTKFAQCCPLQGSIVCQKFRVHTVTGETVFIRSNLQSRLLLLRRSLARRFLRLLGQPAGASSEGNVGPGATSGKKTKHDKGTTTGSSTRSGAKKGHAADPSGQGQVDPDNDNIAAPKSGSKY